MSDMVEPRPNKLTPEMALNAARRMASTLAKKFLVKIDGDEEAEAPRGWRRIVNFEDVESPVSAILDPAGLVSP